MENQDMTSVLALLADAVTKQTEVLDKIAESQKEIGSLHSEIAGLRKNIEHLPELSKKAIQAGHENAEKNRLAAQGMIAAHAAMQKK